MTLNLNLPKVEPQLSPRITVIGVGGAGGNAVNNMITSNLGGVEFLVANTDAQALTQSHCERHIQLGRNITQGLGAGSRPDVGRAAAEEALDDIMAELEGANMVFITAGLGGGTGTGAAPVIARAAREAGMLAVGVVTKPFHFEGVHRMRLAETGLNDLQQYVDTLIIIPNQNLFRVANEKTTFADAFKMADDVLYSGVRGVTDLMVMPGLINLDFADIRSIMTEMGKAMMGTGEANGEGRAVAAAEAAISNPLLDDVSMKGARGVLINITGGNDLTLFEVDEAANRIRDEVDPEANIIFGSTFDGNLEGTMRLSVVATGIDADVAAAPRPVTLSLVSDRAPTLEGDDGGPGEDEIVAASDDHHAFAEQALPEAGDYGQQPGPAAYGGDTEYEEDAEAEEDIPAIQAMDQGDAVAETAEPSTPERNAERRQEQHGAFIAPPPVQAQPAPVRRSVESRREAEPFAAAAMANASRDRGTTAAAPLPPKKSRSLFARVTGAAAARAVSLAESVAEPIMGHAEVEPEPVRREARPEAQPELQPASAREAQREVQREALGTSQRSEPLVGRAPATETRPVAPAAQPAARPTVDRPQAERPLVDRPLVGRPQVEQRAESAPTAQSRDQAPTQAPAAPRLESRIPPHPASRAEADPATRAAGRPAARPETAAPTASQPRLSGLDASEQASSAEEDLLDIPAFLRRQAN